MKAACQIARVCRREKAVDPGISEPGDLGSRDISCLSYAASPGNFTVWGTLSIDWRPQRVYPILDLDPHRIKSLHSW